MGALLEFILRSLLGVAREAGEAEHKESVCEVLHLVVKIGELPGVTPLTGHVGVSCHGISFVKKH